MRAGRAAGGVVELVDPLGPAVDDPQVADVGRVERDARRAGAGAADGPASDERARQVYLNTLSVVESLTTQRYVPSVTMSLGLVLLLLRLKLLAAFWLPESRLAAPV